MAERLQQLGELAGDLGVVEQPVDHRSGGDDHVDAGGQAYRLAQRVPQPDQAQLALEQTDQRHVESDQGARLGGRDQSQDDSGDDDHRRDQRGQGAGQRRQDLAPGRRRMARLQPVAVGVHRVQQHEGGGQQQAGNHPGEEQLAHRGVGQRGIEDHEDARRDDRTDQRAARGQPGGEAPRVAFLFHGRHQQGAECRSVGRGGPVDPGEEHPGDHVDVAEAAAEVADQGVGQAHQARGHAGMVHQVAGQHEQRDRHQREDVHAAEEALRQGVGEQRRVDEEEPHQRGEQQAEEQRQAEQEVDHEGCDHGDGHHACDPPSTVVLAGCRGQGPWSNSMRVSRPKPSGRLSNGQVRLTPRPRLRKRPAFSA